MGGLLIKEPIIEFNPLQSDNKNVIEKDNDNLYNIFPEKDVWIYPWKYTKICLNVASLYFPNQCIGIITPYCPDKISTRTTLIRDISNKESNYVYLKSHSILPIKIKKDTPIVSCAVIRPVECHLVNIH